MSQTTGGCRRAWGGRGGLKWAAMATEDAIKNGYKARLHFTGHHHAPLSLAAVARRRCSGSGRCQANHMGSSLDLGLIS